MELEGVRLVNCEDLVYKEKEDIHINSREYQTELSTQESWCHHPQKKTGLSDEGRGDRACFGHSVMRLQRPRADTCAAHWHVLGRDILVNEFNLGVKFTRQKNNQENVSIIKCRAKIT